MLEILEPGYQLVIEVDHSSGHDRHREDGRVSNLSLVPFSAFSRFGVQLWKIVLGHSGDGSASFVHPCEREVTPDSHVFMSTESGI